MRIRLAIVMAAMIPAACGSSGSTLINDLTVDHGAEAAAEVAPLDETDAEGVDAADAVDLPDRGGEEIAPTCQPGEGCFGDECADGKDCQSGWCMEHMGGGVCSMECAEECPAGYSCKLIAGSPDPTYVCLSDFANLCRPCSSGSDCDSIGGIEDVCVSYGETGSFCGGSCAEGQACPWGFSCKTVQTVDGITTVQCIADAGECPCTDKSVGLALWTPCSRSSEQGKCGGKRLCTEDGLADCDAAVPAPETCNGTDDDCDTVTDNGPGMACRQGSSRSCTATGSGGATCVGTEACLTNCTWSGSCVISATETCNAIDDDCDGTADEDFACVLGAGDPCTTSCGIPSGTRTCGAGCTWGGCLLAAEIACNDCDDDGDGITDEGSWCPVPAVPTTGDLYAVWGASASDLWVAGAGGVVLHRTGGVWSSPPSSTTRSLHGLWVASAADAWAVGDGGAIIRWNGTAWSSDALGLGANLQDVWGPSTSDVWAVGDGGTILRRSSGGVWSPVTSGTTRRLRGVWGVSASYVWAVGDHGAIRFWNGATWAGSGSGTNDDLYAVSGTGTADAWAVGEGGTIRRWDGTLWSGATSPVSVVLRGVWSASTSDAWAVGDGGTVIRWNGFSWSVVPSGIGAALYGVWGASAGDVWAVGAAGTVIRWRQ
jgi:hypothetical protein